MEPAIRWIRACTRATVLFTERVLAGSVQFQELSLLYVGAPLNWFSVISVKYGRYAPPVRMIELTATQENHDLHVGAPDEMLRTESETIFD
jgi:hypothetical protein